MQNFESQSLCFLKKMVLKSWSWRQIGLAIFLLVTWSASHGFAANLSGLGARERIRFGFQRILCAIGLQPGANMSKDQSGEKKIEETNAEIVAKHFVPRWQELGVSAPEIAAWRSQAEGILLRRKNSTKFWLSPEYWAGVDLEISMRKEQGDFPITLTSLDPEFRVSSWQLSQWKGQPLFPPNVFCCEENVGSRSGENFDFGKISGWLEHSRIVGIWLEQEMNLASQRQKADSESESAVFTPMQERAMTNAWVFSRLNVTSFRERNQIESLILRLHNYRIQKSFLLEVIQESPWNVGADIAAELANLWEDFLRRLLHRQDLRALWIQAKVGLELDWQTWPNPGFSAWPVTPEAPKIPNMSVELSSKKWKAYQSDLEKFKVAKKKFAELKRRAKAYESAVRARIPRNWQGSPLEFFEIQLSDSRQSADSVWKFLLAIAARNSSLTSEIANLYFHWNEDGFLAATQATNHRVLLSTFPLQKGGAVLGGAPSLVHFVRHNDDSGRSAGQLGPILMGSQEPPHVPEPPLPPTSGENSN